MIKRCEIFLKLGETRVSVCPLFFKSVVKVSVIEGQRVFSIFRLMQPVMLLKAFQGSLAAFGGELCRARNVWGVRKTLKPWQSSR